MKGKCCRVFCKSTNFCLWQTAKPDRDLPQPFWCGFFQPVFDGCTFNSSWPLDCAYYSDFQQDFFDLLSQHFALLCSSLKCHTLSQTFWCDFSQPVFDGCTFNSSRLLNRTDYPDFQQEFFEPWSQNFAVLLSNYYTTQCKQPLNRSFRQFSFSP